MRTRTLERVTKNFMGKIDEGVVNTRLTTQYVSLLCDVISSRHRERQERERRSVWPRRRKLYGHVRLQKLYTESTTQIFPKWSRQLRYQQVDIRTSRMSSTSRRKETSISQSTSTSSSGVISSSCDLISVQLYRQSDTKFCIWYTLTRVVYVKRICSLFLTIMKKGDSDCNHWLDKTTRKSLWSSSDRNFPCTTVKSSSPRAWRDQKIALEGPTIGRDDQQ